MCHKLLFDDDDAKTKKRNHHPPERVMCLSTVGIINIYTVLVRRNIDV